MSRAHALVAIPFYIAKSFWPSGLSVYYPHSFDVAPVGAAAASAVGALAVTVAVLCAPRHRYLAVGWLWFLGTLVPVLGFVQLGMHVRADRYAYVPQIGLAIVAAWGAVDLCDALLRGPRAALARRALRVVALAVIAALAVASFRQVQVWRNTFTLFEHALAVTPDNFVAHWRLGANHGREGHTTEALAHLSESVRIEPGVAEPQFELGALLMTRGEVAAALSHFERAVAIDPGHAFANAALAEIEAGQGRARDAAAHYRAALRADPDHVVAANNLAYLLATASDRDLRDPAEAIRLAESALRSASASEEAGVLDTLAAAQAAAGQLASAVGTAERAAALARERGNAALASEIERNLAGYRSSLR